MNDFMMLIANLIPMALFIGAIVFLRRKKSAAEKTQEETLSALRDIQRKLDNK